MKEIGKLMSKFHQNKSSGYKTFTRLYEFASYQEKGMRHINTKSIGAYSRTLNGYSITQCCVPREVIKSTINK